MRRRPGAGRLKVVFTEPFPKRSSALPSRDSARSVPDTLYNHPSSDAAVSRVQHMSLASGAHLGPYEVVAAIGAGPSTARGVTP